MLAADPSQLLIARLDALHLPYGREDSFKLCRGRVLGNRVLIGVESSSMDPGNALALATELGMPDACLGLLSPLAAEANTVFFGYEDLGASWVCKVYLEFWDKVKQEILRTGSQAPQLLHLGVKWDTGQPGRHQVAHYHCHPLLNLRIILRRMAACYGSEGPALLCGLAQDIVRTAAQRRPDASMLYLEVSEAGNPRTSFDINLYKSAMLVADASAQLRQAGDFFEIAAAGIEAQLQRLGHCPLGHLSSGVDRHGQPFLSVYGETGRTQA